MVIYGYDNTSNNCNNSYNLLSVYFYGQSG